MNNKPLPTTHQHSMHKTKVQRFYPVACTSQNVKNNQSLYFVECPVLGPPTLSTTPYYFWCGCPKNSAASIRCGSSVEVPCDANTVFSPDQSTLPCRHALFPAPTYPLPYCPGCGRYLKMVRRLHSCYRCTPNTQTICVQSPGCTTLSSTQIVYSFHPGSIATVNC